MVKGDRVLIPFPFTDLSGNKNRPALVLFSDGFDINVPFTSTQMKWKEETEILLKPTPDNGLKKRSLVWFSKLATIDKNLAIGKLRQIDNETFVLVNYNLEKDFQN